MRHPNVYVLNLFELCIVWPNRRDNRACPTIRLKFMSEIEFDLFPIADALRLLPHVERFGRIHLGMT